MPIRKFSSAYASFLNACANLEGRLGAVEDVSEGSSVRLLTAIHVVHV